MSDCHGRGRLWTAYQAMQLLLPLRWRRSEAAGKRAASLTYLPEGRLSEGTGHGWHRVTGGTDNRLSWQPAKRGSAFSEADDRSRVARRSRATVRSGPDPMGLRRAGAGRLPQGACRQTGCWQANGPPEAAHLDGVATPLRSSECAQAMLEFRPPGITANAVGGRWKERSAEKREAGTRCPGGRGSERKYGRLSVGCGRFCRTSLQLARTAYRQRRGLRRRSVLRGRIEHCRQNGVSEC
jgi:hypothetical protein